MVVWSPYLPEISMSGPCAALLWVENACAQQVFTPWSRPPPTQQPSRNPGVHIEEVGSDEEGHLPTAQAQPYVEEAASDDDGKGLVCGNFNGTLMHSIVLCAYKEHVSTHPSDPHQHNRRARRDRHTSPPATYNRGAQQQQQQQHQRGGGMQQQMSVPGFGGGGFGGMFGGGFPNMGAMASAPGSAGFSYSSSSFQSSGPGGLNFQASNSTRMGPNGVRPY